MSDIRKDFETWALQQFEAWLQWKFEGSSKPNQNTIEWMQCAYKAGRAHDVDGLIAEIESVKVDWQNDGQQQKVYATDYLLDIIRRHFEKEG